MSSQAPSLEPNPLPYPFHVEFHTENRQVVCKLFNREVKVDSITLDGLEASSWTLQSLPRLFQERVNRFLSCHNVAPLNSGREPAKMTPASSRPLSFGAVSQLDAVKGPFEGSNPKMINPRTAIAFLNNGRDGSVSVFDLVQNKYSCSMPSWCVSLGSIPIYHDQDKKAIIKGWNSTNDDFEIQTFLNNKSAAQHVVIHVSETQALTADQFGSLYVWDLHKRNSLIGQLPKVVDCRYQPVEYPDVEDERLMNSQKLTCFDQPQIDGDIVSILKLNLNLEIWHLPIKQRVGTFDIRKVKQFGLVAPNVKGFYTNNFTFCNHQLLVIGGSRLTFIDPLSQDHQFHDFETDEIFVEVLSGKVLSIFKEGLYQRVPCSQEHRELVMPLGFETKKIFIEGHFVLLNSKDHKVYFVDLTQMKKTELKVAESFDFDSIVEMKVFENNLYVITTDSQKNNFMIYSFKFDSSSANLIS